MYRRSRWTSLLALLGLLVGACATGGPDETEILWDTWGVPHIYGEDMEGLFYAFGWAQMENHGDLVLRLYGASRGRAAEYWGDGDNRLLLDRWVRTVGIASTAEEWYEAQSPEYRRYIDAFAAGINDYAAEHADRIADDVEIVLPVSAVDVFAHDLRAINYTFVANAGLMVNSQRRLAAGSNAWAVAPSRSASGNAMLLANPHLPWSDLFTWMEVQLIAPGLDAYGAALVGSPILGVAFNDHLGWTHTVNTQDGADLYELTLAEDGYRYDGEIRAFEVDTQVVRVRGSSGDVREEELIVKRSVHGPVISENSDRAIALRVVGENGAGIFEQYVEMARATNLREFERATSRLQMPIFTVMYADRDGHIMHVFGGRTPVRSEGDWSYWSGVVPGDTSGTLWTKTHPYEDLPRVLDPQSGWLQNSNDPPWTTTFPAALDPNDYPPYMAPRGMALRPQRSARMLSEDDEITFDELIQYKHSTRMEMADRVLDELIAAAREANATAQRAAEVLRNWDRQADAESRGAVLFAAWQRQMSGTRLFAEPWSEKEPRATPRGLADRRAAVEALIRAVRDVEQDYGAIDVKWGEVYRLRMGARDLPANGGPGGFGIFRVVGYSPAGDGTFTATSGDSYIAAIEFSDPVRASVMVSYGNATQPHSSHVGDQLELFARKELRPAWRTREEIEANLEARKVVVRH